MVSLGRFICKKILLYLTSCRNVPYIPSTNYQGNLLITLQLTDFLSALQVAIQLTDYSAIRYIFTIPIPHVSGTQMPTVIFKVGIGVDDLRRYATM